MANSALAPAPDRPSVSSLPATATFAIDQYSKTTDDQMNYRFSDCSAPRTDDQARASAHQAIQAFTAAFHQPAQQP
jgi:hypothetical protein